MATYPQATHKQAVKPSEPETVPLSATVSPTTEIITEEIVATAEPSTMTVIEVPTEYFTVVTVPSEQATQPPTHQPTSLPSDPAHEITPTEVVTETATQNTEQSFSKLLSRSGYSLSEIENSGIQQLVIADTYGTQAELYLFTQKEDTWEQEYVSCNGFIGIQGCGTRNSADEQITPQGIFKIGDCFYRDEQPTTWLNTFRITENTYWIDDVESERYNQKIETEDKENLPKSRYMAENENYQYGCIIEYNAVQPVDREKGTAVFMYCGNNATTDGSIAVDKESMSQYLLYLNSAKNPHIIIF